MTYNPLIPQAGDRPTDSQQDILDNFGSIHSVFALNHYTFNDATVAYRGKHKYCSLVSQALAPAAGPATGATELALYTKDVLAQAITDPQVFLRRKSSGTEIQMSCLGDPAWVNPMPLLPNQRAGSSFLPGGFLIQWGYVNAADVGHDPNESNAIKFPIKFSAAPYCILVTAQRQAGASATPMFVSTTTVPTQTKFYIVNTHSVSHDCTWIAIGPA